MTTDSIGDTGLRLTTRQALRLWHGSIAASVRSKGPDLTARQFAILLTVYLAPPPHTVRGIAAALRLTKPVVTRALDRLSELDFVRRKRDEADRRSVLVQRTVVGSVFLSDFADQVVNTAATLEQDSV